MLVPNLRYEEKSKIYLGTLEEAKDIELCLLSEDIEPFLEDTEFGWLIQVYEFDSKKANAIVEEYFIEKNSRQQINLKLNGTGIRFSFFVMIGLIFFFAVTGQFDIGNKWFTQGVLNKKAFFDGEIWRAVTALTLHANAAHLIGNVFALFVLGLSLSQILGAGRGWFCILISGITGNLARVTLHGSSYNSVGASTAVFGAIGLLGGLEFIRRKRLRQRDTWMPIAAATVLLIILGFENDGKTDIMAHIYGFISGLAVSFLINENKVISKEQDLFYKSTFTFLILISWIAAFL